MKTKPTKTILAAAVTSFMLANSASAFYNPKLGRWLSRDPIQETGALLLNSSLVLHAADQDAYVQSQNRADIGTVHPEWRYGDSPNNYQYVLNAPKPSPPPPRPPYDPVP